MPHTLTIFWGAYSAIESSLLNNRQFSNSISLLANP